MEFNTTIANLEQSAQNLARQNPAGLIDPKWSLLFLKHLNDIINYLLTSNQTEINRSILTLVEMIATLDPDNLNYSANRLTKAINAASN